MTSASMTIVKYGETLTNVSTSFPIIGPCYIPPRRGSSADIKRSNERAMMINEYLESMVASKPEKYILIYTWAKLLSTKGNAIKQLYKTSDPKGVHVNESGKDIIIIIMINTLTPESASGSMRNWSSNHSPTAGQQTKEQRLSSSPAQNVAPPVNSN